MTTANHDALPAHVRAAFDEMLAAGGRMFATATGLGQPRWVTPRNDMTLNCLGDTPRRQRPHTVPCHGWTAPLNGAKRCACPCHDEVRPTYQEARAAVLRRVGSHDPNLPDLTPAP